MADDRWVFLREAKWLEPVIPTAQLRAVTVSNDGNPIRVLPQVEKGEYYTIPSKRARRGQCDGIAFVDMTPKQISVPLKGTVSTKDGIALIGIVNAQAKVNDSEESIKRIVVNAQTEESLLVSSVSSALRDGILAYTWREIKTVNGIFLKDAKERLTTILARTQSCFAVDDLTISEEIQPEEKEIAIWFEKQEKDELGRVAERAQLAHTLEAQGTRNEFEWEQERGKMQLGFEKAQKQGEFELKQERDRMELGFERMQKQIPLEAKIAEAKNIALKALAEILATDAGQMAAFPEMVFELKTKLAELEIAQRGKELQLEIAQRGKELKIYEEFLSILGSRQTGIMEGEIRGLKATSIERFVSTLTGGQGKPETVIEGEGKILDEKENKKEETK
ncbi:MAG: SPFH domain-containing protein [Candidatus Doudnabacteria bacterium]